MRRAFVLKVAPDSDFVAGTVEGWVEDVDSGRELKFRSVPQLLEFLSAALKDSGKRHEPQT